MVCGGGLHMTVVLVNSKQLTPTEEGNIYILVYR